MGADPVRADTHRGHPVHGNRVWRVRTPAGSALQKFYRPRSGPFREALRSLLSLLGGAKTPPSADGRFRTEKELLALWKAEGFDVPADLGAELPHLADRRVIVMEDVPGPLLGRLLVGDALDEPRREDLLRRFAADWGRRHTRARAAADARLVQEHATFLHVIVSGERLVTFDLERGFRRGRAPAPLVAKEVAGYLRSLAKAVPEERFDRDVRILVDAYPDPVILAGAADEYLRNPNPLRRLLWRLDERLRAGRPRKQAKYRALRALDAALRTAPGGNGPGRST